MILTVTIPVMGGNFFSSGNSTESAERDVLALPKKLAIIVAIVLQANFDVKTRRLKSIDYQKLTFTNLAGPKNRWFFFI